MLSVGSSEDAGTAVQLAMRVQTDSAEQRDDFDKEQQELLASIAPQQYVEVQCLILVTAVAFFYSAHTNFDLLTVLFHPLGAGDTCSCGTLAGRTSKWLLYQKVHIVATSNTN